MCCGKNSSERFITGFERMDMSKYILGKHPVAWESLSILNRDLITPRVAVTMAPLSAKKLLIFGGVTGFGGFTLF